MTKKDWKEICENLLNGVEQELRSTVPVNVRASLDTFRQRLDRDSIVRRRKRFERELEALLRGNPSLRAAANRYLSKKVKSALKTIVRVLNRTMRVLKEQQERKTHTKPAKLSS